MPPARWVFILALTSLVHGYQNVCQNIASAISQKSAVYYPGDTLYAKDIYHYANSSTQQSLCTVEPGTARDVGKILRILGSTRTPFSVKSGGHMMNSGFSSSPDVQIAMYRFSEVTYDSKTQTAVIGTGLIFDDVYAALAPHNVSVAGGRVTGIGVGGFLLGGGYSWKTNQYGLGLDTITAYELVKPNGKVVRVTEKSDAKLFFGLKGGYNNFGIVTRFTMKALPQPSIWGGSIGYAASSAPDVTDATIKFSATNTDPKANIITSYIYFNNSYFVSLLMYYDDPSPPQGLFDEFLKIPSLSQDVRERSLFDFIRMPTTNGTAGLRGSFHTVPLLENTPNTMKVVQNETNFWGAQVTKSGGFVGYSVEPFLSSILSHNNEPTAYPPTRDKVYLPLNLFFGWTDPAFDNDFHAAIHQSAAHIRDAAIKEGQDIADAFLYPNYAIYDTPLRSMYGDNVDKLRLLRKSVDPQGVMGLAGGFKF